MLYYNQFLLEKEFRTWEISGSINESMEQLYNKIDNFLDKEYELDTAGFEKFVVNLINRFKGKIKILTIITTILLASFFNKDKMISLFDKANVSVTEQETLLSNASDSVSKKITNSVKKHGSEVKKFLNALAESESSMDPNSVNKFGYIGKYQFGKKALIDLGLEDKIDTHKFIKNPNIFPEHAQDKAMVKLLKINKTYLGDYIKNYDGKTISGIHITKSGLLAGSHLVGAKAVKDFLDSNGSYIPKDGNNVPVTFYIKKFGGYNLTF